MATLTNLETGEVRPVPARLLVGRGPSCGLRLDDRLVSGEHATLSWTGKGWVIRDLGSRNGTFLDGTRLETGVAASVGPGACLGFGTETATWAVMDVEAPSPLAENLATGAICRATRGILGIPPDTPEVVVYADARGRWSLEAGDADVRVISDGEVVQVGGEPWRVWVPEELEGTANAATRPTLDLIRVRFEVSRDEEFVRITVLHRGTELPLEPREHAYTLLTLARARLADADAPAAEQGWLDRDSLLRMLALDSNALNVAIYRARGQLAEAGVEGAAGIVEVRRGKRRMGIEPDQIEIRALA